MNFFSAFLITFLTLSSNVFAREEIKVGAYDFPPYAKVTHNQVSGIVVNFIDLLNRVQSEYRFTLVATSSNRRFEDLKLKKFDMMIFESVHWGWKEREVEYFPFNLRDGEFYVYRKNKVNEDEFLNFKERSISAILGFHYGFANFNSDQNYLKKNFDIFLSTSHIKNLERVQKERSDITIVTKSFYNMLKSQNSPYTHNLQHSKKYDQTYNIGAVKRKGLNIKGKYFEDVLKSPQFKIIRKSLDI